MKKVWATVSRYPIGTDVAAEEAKTSRLIAAFRRAAPDASEVAIRLAQLRITLERHLQQPEPDFAESTSQITRLKSALTELSAALEAIHPRAFSAIDLETEDALRDVGRNASRKYRQSRDEGPPKDVSERDRMSRVRKRTGRARAATKTTAEIFRELTGRTPTIITPPSGGKAYGPFLELLADVFYILEINASPESQARDVLRLMEKSEPRTGK